MMEAGEALKPMKRMYQCCSFLHPRIKMYPWMQREQLKLGYEDCGCGRTGWWCNRCSTAVCSVEGKEKIIDRRAMYNKSVASQSF
jgi:hypothetical protein